MVLSDKAAGESVKSKIENLQKDVEKQGCEYALVSSLDDIAWLFNMRGSDIEYNPRKLCVRNRVKGRRNAVY